MAKPKGAKPSPARLAFEAGLKQVKDNPIWSGLVLRMSVVPSKQLEFARDTWCRVTATGEVFAHPTRQASAGEWAYMLGFAMLYLGFDHFQRDRSYWREWNAACDVTIARFLRDLKFATPPEDRLLTDDLPAWDENRWYREFCSNGIPEHLGLLGPGCAAQPGMWLDAPTEVSHDRYAYGYGYRQTRPMTFAQAFAAGLRNALQEAVDRAAKARNSSAQPGDRLTPQTRAARSWFMSSFPLLGALVASFQLIEDAAVCRRADISIAAVNESAREIYLNPHAGLSESELRFVIAHEVLHVGLRHGDRCSGRDPFLWNVACDFVINGWLIEMGVGAPPQMGLLHDPELAGLSAEAVYDRIVTDLRRYRKLATFAGNQCDILPTTSSLRDATDLDAFYRNQLSQGLALHESQSRGTLPAGLVEEIRALTQPPIEWDVQLARWFDAHFPPLEARRSYARASRRQSATPDIPRPHWVIDATLREGRVFGVVLDTSGSMDRTLLGKALGAIASYSMSRDVLAVRVVFCDARAHDAGYMAPQDIAGRVQVRGRGGTVLQPGIDLIEHARDFPPDGPVLVITDGMCDRFVVHRKHAVLMPRGARLPFVPRSDVFYLA